MADALFEEERKERGSILINARENCVYKEGFYKNAQDWATPCYVKDLSIVTDDFTRLLLVDNNPDSFFQPANGILVPDFLDPKAEDRVLERVREILETLAVQPDVRGGSQSAKIYASLLTEQPSASTRESLHKMLADSTKYA